MIQKRTAGQKGKRNSSHSAKKNPLFRHEAGRALASLLHYVFKEMPMSLDLRLGDTYRVEISGESASRELEEKRLENLKFQRIVGKSPAIIQVSLHKRPVHRSYGRG
jgi:hypothetical protein